MSNSTIFGCGVGCGVVVNDGVGCGDDFDKFFCFCKFIN